MTLEEAMRARHMVRKYTDKPLPGDIVAQLLHAYTRLLSGWTPLPPHDSRYPKPTRPYNDTDCLGPDNRNNGCP